ncbi:MAG: long-chain fatty acid--CoA ligase, partial [Rhodospirillales bacterium]|nr:long-chain fatty acid--CoA ligase [Rhodospirillales bacterium]
QAMVYGDKRPNLVALIVPDETWFQDWTKESGKTGSLSDLKDDPNLRAAMSETLDGINKPLSNIEKVRRYIIADEPFTIDNGEMTPTMKVRRHVLKDRYGERLEGLYRS